MLLLARTLPGSPEDKGSFIHLLIQVFIAQALQSRIPACLLFHLHLFLLQLLACALFLDHSCLTSKRSFSSSQPGGQGLLGPRINTACPRNLSSPLPAPCK